MTAIWYNVIMVTMNTKRLVEKGTYYLTPETLKRLRILAATSGITQSNLVEQALILLFSTPGETK